MFSAFNKKFFKKINHIDINFLISYHLNKQQRCEFATMKALYYNLKSKAEKYQLPIHSYNRKRHSKNRFKDGVNKI